MSQKKLRNSNPKQKASGALRQVCAAGNVNPIIQKESTMQTLQDLQSEVKTEFAFYVGDGQAQRNEQAWQLGHETGMAGGYPQGTQMYEICSPEWDAYADGYEAGKTTFMLVAPGNVYSGPAGNEYPIFTSRTSRNEFLALIGGA